MNRKPERASADMSSFRNVNTCEHDITGEIHYGYTVRAYSDDNVCGDKPLSFDSNTVSMTAYEVDSASLNSG